MVPHATTAGFEHRRSPSPTKVPFPDFEPDHATFNDEDFSRGPSPEPLPNGLPLGLHSSERWPAAKKRDAHAGAWTPWAAKTSVTGKTRNGRQKSLSEAIRTVRTRGRTMSISQNAHEIAESLKAPVSFKLIALCTAWSATSIVTNMSSKAILTSLPKPVTLTIMQFLLVSFWCIFLARLAQGSPWLRENVPVLKNGIRKPNKEIIMATLPLTAFQIGGHILNSDAMSKIPVSLVHTIKGLSPLMTVVACRIFFQVKYSVPTYLSLVPLTIGVILACSASFQGNFLGFLYAFASAILFVTQNIVSKKLFTDSARAEADGVPLGRRKPDKLNLLCYSSAMALIFTFPIWLWSEGFAILADLWSDGSIDLRYWKPGSLDHGRLTLEFFFNGTFHFGQSLVAFVLLGLTSPVTYSVASLIKRVVVIMFAIVWFGNPMTRVQGFGFLLTFLGLYLYDRTSDAAKQDKRAREKDAANDHLLPLSMGDAKKDDDAGATGPPFAQSPGTTNGNGDGYHGSNHGDYAIGLGTRAHETWNENDKAWQQPVVR